MELAALGLVRPDTPAESSALCAHIVQRFHDLHRSQFPELIRLSRRVEAVHRDHSDAPVGLADHLEATWQQLSEHMRIEENVLFPAIRSGYPGPLTGPIQAMRHEHAQHADALAEIERLTDNLTPPANACRSWQALYTGLEQLRSLT